MLARMTTTLGRLPILMKAGLAITLAGGSLDVGYHLLAAAAEAHGPVASAAHLIVLVGMVVTMLGLLGPAFKRRPTSSPTSTIEGDIR